MKQTSGEAGVLVERRTILVMAGIAIAYFATANIGLLWAVGDSNATPLWAPAGIAVASVLVFRQSVWLGVFLGAFAANLTHFLQQGLPIWAMLVGSLFIAAGNSLEAFLIKRLCFKRLEGNPLDEVFNLLKFVPIVMVSSLAAAAVGTLTMIALGLNTFATSPLIFVTWWLGDTLGILVFAPFLISWLLPSSGESHGKWPELIAACAALFVLCELIFWNHVPVSQIASRPWWLVPVLLWFVFRFSRREVATAVTMVCLAAIFATAHNKGPFVASNLSEAFLSEQLFCAMITITMLLLSASLTKTARYQLSLKESNEQLEVRVQERTHELEKKSRILEAINRQLRIEAQERLAAETELHNLQAKKS